MTLPAWLTCSALWTVALVRIILAVRRVAFWRVAFASSTASLALAATLHFVQEGLDRHLGVPNLANLLARLSLISAVCWAQLYLLDTRKTLDRGPSAKTVAFAAATTCVATIGGWVATPALHAREFLHLADVPGSTAMWIYVVSVYAYAAWFLADHTVYMQRQYRSVRSVDPPAAVAAMLMIGAGWSGLPVLALFTINVIVTQYVVTAPRLADELATALLPLPLVLMSAGFLAPLLLPRLAHRRSSRRLIRDLDALATTLTRTHPQVVLPHMQGPLARLIAPDFVAQRRIIEVTDALEEHTVAPVSTLAELADQVRRPPATVGVPAVDNLRLIDSSEWPRPLIRLNAALVTHIHLERTHD